MFKIAVILSNIRSLHNVGSILRAPMALGKSYFLPATLRILYSQTIPACPMSHEKLPSKFIKPRWAARLLPASIHATTADAIKAAKEAGYTVVALGTSQ